MTEKEVAEIRRRFRQEKSNITHIHGCYVNENREIVSEFDQSLALLSQEEAEKFLGILKRTLSGVLGKNLIDISFETQQVVDSEEHKLLMALRDSSLKDEASVRAFFERVMQSLALEGSYLILLAHDNYDVPYQAKDGYALEDASSEVYSYILCSICPIKMTKPALGYYVYENEFHDCKLDWIVSAPALGFIFPAFDDRSANLYNALYYTKDITANHTEFVDTIFNRELPLPAAVQKETFQTMLSDTLAEDCSLEVVQAVHDQFFEIIEAHKADKESPPPALSKREVSQVLQSCGISESGTSAFEERYDMAFGAETTLSPLNIIDKKLEVRTPDVTIQVNPDRRDLIETRVIDGVKYLLIRAGEGVEVNGVGIQIT